MSIVVEKKFGRIPLGREPLEVGTIVVFTRNAPPEDLFPRSALAVVLCTANDKLKVRRAIGTSSSIDLYSGENLEHEGLYVLTNIPFMRKQIIYQA